MHLSAHLDVDVVALEANDTVTVLLGLVHRPRSRTPPAPITPSSSSSTAPAPWAAAASSTPRARCSPGRPARRPGPIRAGRVRRPGAGRRPGRYCRRQRARRDPPPHRRPGDRGLDRPVVGLPARPAGGPPRLHRTGATIVLLSDGHANAGVTDPDALGGVARKAAQQAITTSTIGIGLGYDQRLLAAVARGGSGNPRSPSTPTPQPPRSPRSTASCPRPPRPRACTSRRLADVRSRHRAQPALDRGQGRRPGQLVARRQPARSS